jgi:dTMP kinase
MAGLFVSFEGTEGSGKTSVIKEVVAHFQKQGKQVVVTREPGGSRISEKIRTIILDKSHTEMDARCEALLFAASRRQHLVETINPALQLGKLVLCDRFVDSSLVYQGIARGLGFDEVLEINKYAIEDTFPDLTIFVNVRPEVGLARVFASNLREVNRLDLEQLNFHQRIYDGYLELIQLFPHRIKNVVGERSIKEVVQDVILLIEQAWATHE